MAIAHRSLAAAGLIAVWFIASCAGNTSMGQNDVPVQPGEVVAAKPPAAPLPGTNPAPSTPTNTTPATPTNPGTQNPPAPVTPPVIPPVTPPVQPPKEEPPTPNPVPTPNPTPTPVPPTSTSPCPVNYPELPVGTWGAPDVALNVASQSGVAHGDFVTSAGFGLCGALLETRTRAGLLVGRYYLPQGLMDYYTGIAKYPRGGFILSGMRTEAPAIPQSGVIHRMVIALVDEKANLIWKNDFAPEGPSLQNWGYAVVTDKEGNSYVAANLNGFSVVKISPKGERLWTYNYAENSGVARAIRFDAEGNVVVTGYIDVNLQSQYGDRDVFVIKLSPKKKIIWKHRVVSPTLDYAYDLAINAAGQTWILGWSYDQGVKFGKKALHLPAAFLICLEANGTRSRIIDVGTNAYTARVEILPNQRILISGSSMTSPLAFGLFSADGLTRIAEKSFPNAYWNILTFMAQGSQGDIYVGMGSGTPLGQPPAYSFGSIRKLFESDITSK